MFLSSLLENQLLHAFLEDDPHTAQDPDIVHSQSNSTEPEKHETLFSLKPFMRSTMLHYRLARFHFLYLLRTPE